MPKISVIVPARDVGEYVGAVLGDLRDQTYADFEGIVVDDGSTDNTPEVVSDFADSDQRFCQLSSEGAGVSAARNLGVERAQGEFLAFVDADDRLSPDYLRKLHESIVATGSDLVSGNAQRLEGFRTSASALHQRACAQPRDGTHLSRSPQLVWDTTVWNKLWRRTMWDRAGIRYSDGRWVNDFLPCMQGHVASHQVDVLSDVIYYWRVRTDPTTSITDRRLTDPEARLKSFDDRLFAISRARALLADELPLPAVLSAFDYRVLHNDLPIYLPYYVGSGDDYQRLLVSRIRELLEHYDIQPGRFPFGVLLQSVYRAILADDHDSLLTLLDPKTHVTPSATRRQSIELIAPASATTTSSARPAIAYGRGRWLLRRLHPGLTEPSRVTAMAKVDRVDTDSPAPGHLAIHGAVRIREGRSDVAGPWTAVCRLDGVPRGLHLLRPLGPLRGWFSEKVSRILRVLSLTTRVTGTPSAVEPPPDATLHPLVRSGWRPFTASVNVGEAERHRSVNDWVLGLQLQAGRMTVYARTTLAAQVVRSLPPRSGVAEDADLVPAVDGIRRLHLRRSPAPLRLQDVSATPAGTVLHLSTASLAGLMRPRIWLQTGDGRHRTRTVTATPKVRLPLPDNLADGSPEYELWCRTRSTNGRVRAGPGLRTTPIVESTSVDGGDIEAVVRPTRRGNVVLELREQRLDLRWAGPDETVNTLAIGGSGDPSHLGAKSLELHCRWSDDRVSTAIEVDSGGWRATVPLDALVNRDESRTRLWSIEVSDSAGAKTPLRIPSELQSRFPLCVDLGLEAAYLLLDERLTPMLTLTPENGDEKWPKLRRVQRSETRAAGRKGDT